MMKIITVVWCLCGFLGLRGLKCRDQLENRAPKWDTGGNEKSRGQPGVEAL
jgi:hypothetical protein